MAGGNIAVTEGRIPTLRVGGMAYQNFVADEDGLVPFSYAFFTTSSRVRGVVGALLTKGLRVCVGARFTVTGDNGCLGFEVMEDLKAKQLLRAKLIYEDVDTE